VGKVKRLQNQMKFHTDILPVVSCITIYKSPYSQCTYFSNR